MRRFRIATVLLSSLFLNACLKSDASRADREMFGFGKTANAAWAAWQKGDAEQALAVARKAVADGNGTDEDLKVMVLALHFKGRYREAIESYGRISAGYRGRAALDETLLWAHVKSGDLAGAIAFAEARGLLRDASLRGRLEIASAHPMQVEISAAGAIPFTEDPFSPVMPGIPVRFAGREMVARLDTGGSYVHVTKSLAKSLGIAHEACEKGFLGLMTGEICYGISDLSFGPVTIRNVPVVVSEDRSVPSAAIAEAFGVETGPIIGTNVFEQFLVTFDGPGNRLLVAPRGSAPPVLAGARHEVPFGIVGDHYMIAGGSAGGQQALFFIDSGLAVIRDDQGQAAILASNAKLSEWRIEAPRDGRFAELTFPVALGSAVETGLTAVAVPNRQWRNFGSWEGIAVDALLSHAFLKRYAWTMDFDRRVFILQGG